MRPYRISVLALCLATTATTTAAFAQEAPVDLGQVFVWSQMSPVAADRTGAAPAVLEAPHRHGALTSALSALPGFSFATKGPIGQQSGFTLRGVSQNYVPVFFEGIEISDPSSPQTAADLGPLTGAGLGRVEVLAGAQSALYGSRAIGGVINMGMPRGQEMGTSHSLSAEAGSYGTKALGYTFSHEDDDRSSSFTLDHFETEGFSAASSGTEKDGFESNRAALHVDRTLQNGVRIGAAGFVLKADVDYDGSDPITWAPADADYTSTRHDKALRLWTDFDAAGFGQSLSFTHYSTKREHAEESPRTYDGKRNRLAWQATGNIAPGMDLGLGMDLQDERYSENSAWDVSQGDTLQKGIYAEFAFAPRENLDLTVSMRRDDHDSYGSFESTRFAGALRPNEDWVLRAQAGTGFRAPSGYELYGPYGDASLTPERSTSFETSAERVLPQGGMLRATAFWLEVDDLIDFAGSGYSQVEGKSARRGLELSTSAALSDGLSLSANYTHTDFLSNGASSWKDSARNLFNIALTAELSEEATASLSLTHGANRPSLPDYTVLSAEYGRSLGNGYALSLRAENLTNEDYELVGGYATSGRAAYVGLKAAF